ncbi:MAG: hypothetical protein KDA92_22325, partial [Planctomycetales bacterium]|nr:hypothetical protein [Planctomycetales bacterium]
MLMGIVTNSSAVRTERIRVCRVITLLAAVGALSLSAGCAAITNPTLNGIPVRRLPTELLAAPRRESCQTIPLSLLRQSPSEDYLLGPGDVLGLFVPGVLPPAYEDQALTLPPVNYPAGGTNLPPSMGYPVTVR